MWGTNLIDMFDRVRVRQTSESVRLGLAGLVGQVLGDTTPSATGVEVIGNPSTDKAYNVSIQGQSSDLWFAPEQVELVDHAPGTDIRIGNARLVREADGSWREMKRDGEPGDG
jgi:hypothetical protein